MILVVIICDIVFFRNQKFLFFSKISKLKMISYFSKFIIFGKMNLDIDRY